MQQTGVAIPRALRVNVPRTDAAAVAKLMMRERRMREEADARLLADSKVYNFSIKQRLERDHAGNVIPSTVVRVSMRNATFRKIKGIFFKIFFFAQILLVCEIAQAEGTIRRGQRRRKGIVEKSN